MPQAEPAKWGIWTSWHCREAFPDEAEFLYKALPEVDMVGVHKARFATAGETAALIAQAQRAANRGRDRAGLAAHVQYVAEGSSSAVTSEASQARRFAVAADSGKMHMVIHLHGAIVARLPENLWVGNTASSTSLTAGGTLVYLAERAEHAKKELP
jgi:hypothetical protein